MNKEKLKQHTIAAFREKQEDDKRNYSRGWPGANKEQQELFERAYSDRLWERKIVGFSGEVVGGVLALDIGVYSLTIAKNSDAYQDVTNGQK